MPQVCPDEYNRTVLDYLADSSHLRVLEEEFERSDAFAWLTRRAGEFGFRMSYPRDNPHGVAYEPWHWAWWGDT